MHPAKALHKHNVPIGQAKYPTEKRAYRNREARPRPITQDQIWPRLYHHDRRGRERPERRPDGGKVRLPNLPAAGDDEHRVGVPRPRRPHPVEAGGIGIGHDIEEGRVAIGGKGGDQAHHLGGVSTGSKDAKGAGGAVPPALAGGEASIGACGFRGEATTSTDRYHYEKGSDDYQREREGCDSRYWRRNDDHF